MTDERARVPSLLDLVEREEGSEVAERALRRVRAAALAEANRLRRAAHPERLRALSSDFSSRLCAASALALPPELRAVVHLADASIGTGSAFDAKQRASMGALRFLGNVLCLGAPVGFRGTGDAGCSALARALLAASPARRERAAEHAGLAVAAAVCRDLDRAVATALLRRLGNKRGRVAEWVASLPPPSLGLARALEESASALPADATGREVARALGIPVLASLVTAAAPDVAAAAEAALPPARRASRGFDASWLGVIARAFAKVKEDCDVD
jgi:hypothetical protein